MAARDGASYVRNKYWNEMMWCEPTVKRLIPWREDHIKVGLRDPTKPDAEFEYEEKMELTWRNPELETFLRQVASKTQENVGYTMDECQKGVRLTRLVLPTSGRTVVEVEGRPYEMEFEIDAGDCVHLLTGSRYVHDFYGHWYGKEYQDRNAELYKSPPGHTVVLIQQDGPGNKKRYGKIRKGDTLYDHRYKKPPCRNARKREIRRNAGGY